jgi:S1-C subfamily serine protease
MMRRAIALLACVMASALPALAAGALPGLQDPFRAIVGRGSASIVRVASVGTSQERTIRSTPIGTRAASLGGGRRPAAAGVAIAPEWVITHKLRGREDLVVVATSTGALLRGSVAARLSNLPLSLVHVPGARLKPVPISGPVAPIVGSWVLVMGNAFGTSAHGTPSVTLGLLSARHHDEAGTPTFLVSAAVNPGDPGGAVLDASGRLVGIVTGGRGVGDLAEVAPIGTVLEGFGKIEGLTVEIAKEKAPETSIAAISRHIHGLAKAAHPVVVSLIVKRTSKAKRPRLGPVRSGRTLLEPYPIKDRAVTGTLVDKMGTIVTAYVNLADAEGRLEDADGKSLLASVTAVLPDGRMMPAALVGAHEGKGVAVLRVDAPDLATVPTGAGRDLAIGRWLLTLGNPFGEERCSLPLVGFGIVSDHASFPERYDAILTDAPINTANAGGPVMDMEGRLVGIAVVAVSPKDASMPYGLNSGIGFVVPIEDVIGLIPRIEKDGIVRFRPGYLGVRLSLTAEAGGGVRVRTVMPDTGAKKGGLKSDDVIKAINGQAVTEGTALRQILYAMAPGTKVTLAVLRGRQMLTLEIELSLRPELRD